MPSSAPWAHWAGSHRSRSEGGIAMRGQQLEGPGYGGGGWRMPTATRFPAGQRGGAGGGNQALKPLALTSHTSMG